MNKEMVSIIVPVYNTSKYLPKCLDSLINQTYKNIEIIIVNDGSTDNSLDICQECANFDNRIKIFNKVNGGLQQARKFGLSKISTNSSYIMFVDSDDFLEVKAVEESIKMMDDETDVVLFCFYQYSKLLKKVFHLELEPVITHDVFMNKYYKGFFGALAFPVQAWGKLYRKELFDGVEFYNNFMGEDLCINLQTLPKARKMVVLSKPLYYYRFGGGSSKFNSRLIEDYAIIKKVQSEAVKKYGLNEDCYRLINTETANVFFTFVKSYLLTISDYSQIDYEFINKCYNDYSYISDAVEYFENKDINELVKIDNNRKHVELLCTFDAQKYVDYIINEIRIENRSIKNKIIRIIKSVI